MIGFPNGKRGKTTGTSKICNKRRNASVSNMHLHNVLKGMTATWDGGKLCITSHQSKAFRTSHVFSSQNDDSELKLHLLVHLHITGGAEGRPNPYRKMNIIYVEDRHMNLS